MKHDADYWKRSISEYNGFCDCGVALIITAFVTYITMNDWIISAWMVVGFAGSLILSFGLVMAIVCSRMYDRVSGDVNKV